MMKIEIKPNKIIRKYLIQKKIINYKYDKGRGNSNIILFSVIL